MAIHPQAIITISILKFGKYEPVFNHALECYWNWDKYDLLASHASRPVKTDNLGAASAYKKSKIMTFRVISKKKLVTKSKW